MMLIKLSKISLRCAGWLLALSFAVSLFMCGDADCLTGNGDENCASLLCSLLSKHDAASQNATGNTDKDCACVCHVPTVAGHIFNFSYHPVTQYNTAFATLQMCSAPSRLVYHPPAAV